MRLLTVDDHHVLRQSFALLLCQEFDDLTIDQCGSFEEAKELWLRHRHRVAIVDLNLPDISGMELCSFILDRQPDSHLMVFTMHEELQLVRRLLNLGVKCFVTKSASPECILEAVNHLRNGQSYIEPAVSQRLVLANLHEEDNPLGNLSNREQEIFILAARGKTSREIAELLQLSSKTVANRMTEIKLKLGVHNSAGMAHLAISCGLIKVS